MNEIDKLILEKLKLNISNFRFENESKDYNACQYKLNDFNIISRNSKITPSKPGQFVTIWKRIKKGPIEPFHFKDKFDVIIIKCQTKDNYGQFIFPKSILISKKIISSDITEGKRGFRVYPNWDKTTNNQAKRTQEWQLNYFLDLTNKNKINFELALKLYSI